nr:cupin domain-containing protein [Aquabacterium sp. NJ1]
MGFRLYEAASIGRDLDSVELFSLVIPGDSWFVLRCEMAGSFSLIGCTVAPGFDFEDFSLDDRAVLLGKFPQHAVLVREMAFEQEAFPGT